MSSSDKLVSIIIPCYNSAALIEETLDSLARQTFKDFEVICVNDGSKDNTLAVLTQYAERGTLQLKVISKENGGVSKARNRGIDEAQGKYILFLDSDDLYHPEMLEHMVMPMETENVDTVYCRLTRELSELDTVSITPMKHQDQKSAMNKLLLEMGSYGFYCYIYRRDVLKRENLRFDENTRYFEDREFNWKYLCHCREYGWIDASMYGYRISPNSVMQKKTSWERTVGSLNAVRRVEAYMEQAQCEYLDILKSYLYQRVMWGVAKNIALSGDKVLFTRLRNEFDVKKCMKRTAKDNNKLVALASRMYLIHPMLFFWLVGLKK